MNIYDSVFFLQLYNINILIYTYFYQKIIDRDYLTFGVMLRRYDKATSRELRQMRRVPNLLKFVVVFMDDECV